MNMCLLPIDMFTIQMNDMPVLLDMELDWLISPKYHEPGVGKNWT